MRNTTLAALIWCITLSGLAGENSLPANTWVKVNIDWKAALPKNIKGARWSTGDGYSDNIYRSKTGTVIIRTGVRSKSAGLNPGYYTNTSVEWDLKTDTAKTINVVPWGGGSGGNGKLLAGYKDNKAPTPRHTYDGICYVPETDEMYMMLGANWKVGHRQATAEAKAELKKDAGRTWSWSFAKKRWTCIEDNVWKHVKTSPYENHMTHWPEGKKLLFLNDGGNRYAEFDLTTKKWAKVALKNKRPHSLYHARSTWDSKRGLWVFRKGPLLSTFNPKTRTFTKLPNCWDMKIPTREEFKAMKKAKKKADKRLNWKGVCYISKHDAYLVSGPTGDETMVYHVAEKKWRSVKGGKIELRNGYCQYNPELDLVAMNIQQHTYKFKYVPEKKDTEKK
jgi:hypothetical protein